MKVPRRISALVRFALLYFLVSGLVPVVPARANRQQAGRATELVSASQINLDVGVLQGGFANETGTMGLMPIGDVHIDRISPEVSRATLMAGTSPFSRRLSPVYFLRRDLFFVGYSDGTTDAIAQSQVTASCAGNHVSVQLTFTFTEGIDSLIGVKTSLRRVRIQRTAGFDIDGFEALVGSLTPDNFGLRLTEMVQRGEIDYRNYTESVSVTGSDGITRTYTGSQINIAEALGGCLATATCIYDCFVAAQVPIGLGAAFCVAVGAGICVATCTSPLAPACIPCWEAVGLGCGIGPALAELGALIACIVGCITGNANIAQQLQGCENVPSLSIYGLIVLALFIVGTALWLFRKKRSAIVT